MKTWTPRQVHGAARLLSTLQGQDPHAAASLALALAGHEDELAARAWLPSRLPDRTAAQQRAADWRALARQLLHPPTTA